MSCRALTATSAKREATVIYRFGKENAVWQIAQGEDKVIIAERVGYGGKWTKYVHDEIEEQR
jgi:hypothetical protein